MIRNLRLKILLIVLVTCLLLLTVVLAFVFTSIKEAMLSDPYSSMIWVLDDIERGRYYGVPKGAPRQMTILFMNPDGTLDEFATDDDIQIISEIGGYTEIFDTFLQYDGSPDQYSIGDSSYLYRYSVLPDGRTVFIFVDVTMNMQVLQTFQKNAVIASIVAMFVMLILSLIFASWIIRPIARSKESQQEFFTAASHDLRTPLTVILANVGLLNEFDNTDPVFVQCRENIQAEAEQMKQLLQVILENLTHEDKNAKRYISMKEDIDLGSLAMNNILSFEPLFTRRGRKLQHDIIDNLWTRGNRNDLERVVGILLDNALKYSHNDSNTFVRLRSVNARTLQLDVHSVSEPMDKRTLIKIFMPFYRVDPSRNDRDSYGLGLSTAKNIMKLHGGKIWATSGKHENVFHISLPQIDALQKLQ